MDPFLMQMMKSMQGTEALQPSFGDALGGGAPAADAGTILGMPSEEFAQMLSGIKAPTPAKPQFSGGVSGGGLPFLQSMPNLLAPGLNASAQRIASTPQLPSLGQLLGGA